MPGTARASQRAETRQTRTRPAARAEEPPPGHPPQRGQDRQARQTQQGKPQADRLNNKLRRCPLDLLAEFTTGADAVILTPGGPVMLTAEDQRQHLPGDFQREAPGARRHPDLFLPGKQN